MDRILVEGGVPLQGTVEVRGAKNAALPILFATVLTDARSVIRRVPYLRDVTTTLEILTELAMRCERLVDGSISVEVEEPETYTAPYEKVCEMRASICTLGPPRSPEAGAGLEAQRLQLRHEAHRPPEARRSAPTSGQSRLIEAEAEALRGATIYLGRPFGSSVLATANVMIAATLAKRTTVIKGAPPGRGPGKFPTPWGAHHERPAAVIDGVPERARDHEIILTASRPAPSHRGGHLAGRGGRRGAHQGLGAVTDILRQAGFDLRRGRDPSHERRLPPVDVTTLGTPVSRPTSRPR
jgi:UDP-N-acetylglucosamine 1-carboxyvinyltransferase